MKGIEAQRNENLFSDRLRNVFTWKWILLSKWGDAEIYFSECPLGRINWIDIDLEAASWRPWSWGRRGQCLLLRTRLNIPISVLGQSGNVRNDLSHSQCAKFWRLEKMNVIDWSGLCEVYPVHAHWKVSGPTTTEVWPGRF